MLLFQLQGNLLKEKNVDSNNRIGKIKHEYE